MNIKRICSKCKDQNWGYWTSSSTGKIHPYCKTCRQQRAKKYHTRKRKAKGTHSTLQWKKKLELYYKCPCCQRPWNSIPPRPDKRYKYVWTKDHIIPLNKGGTDDIGNIQPLCLQCNFGKR